MAVQQPQLPYAQDALAPHISEETLSFHFGKHHMGYYNKLVAKIESGDVDKDASLEDLIANAEGGVYNLAAQIWNHTFYWNSMSGNGGGAPTGIWFFVGFDV